MKDRFANELPGFGICVGLIFLIWAVFGETLQHGFLNYDDNFYVFANPEVTGGLTKHSIAAAFTHSDLFLWTPLTRISHVFDVQLYQLRPAGHHLTNLLLHAAATLILFVALQKMTGALWRSAFVAAVFAIHPLHVESVAWISERKDVLSGLFFMLTLLAYVYYARKPSSLDRYVPVVLFYLLGLLSKPMLLTVPFVLLLLDYWPLKRFNLTNQPQDGVTGVSIDRLTIPPPLIREKIPLFLLSAASMAIALFDPFKWNGTRPDFFPHPFFLRVQNAIVSYAIYIWQMFYPRNLAVRYPFPEGGIPVWQVVLSLGLLLIITAVAFKERRRWPYLLVGWLWYLGMLLPVIGIVELGGEAHSDRYTYLSQIGLYLLVAWSVNDLTKTWRWRQKILGATMCAVLLALTFSARAQVARWRTNESLWTHTLAVTSDNWLAENNLSGTFLDEPGKLELARFHATEALRIHPNYFEAHLNLGVALMRLGRTFEALREMEQAYALQPNSLAAQYNLGAVLALAGRTDEAIPHLSQVLRLNPNSVAALKSLGWIRATQPAAAGKSEVALQLANRAVKITGSQDPTALDLLAVALAAAGRFDEAIKVAEQARSLATAQNQSALAREIAERLDLYRLNLPYLTK